MSSESASLAILGIGHLCSIRSAEGLSLRDALARVKYAQVRPELNVNDLREVIARQPTLVDEWYLYSADKRTTGGWYLSANLCEIGQVGNPDSLERFPTAQEAVAEYVLRELDFWFECGLPPNKSLERTRAR